MKNQLCILSKTGGWIAVSLGIIHLCYTFILTGALTHFNPGLKGTFIFMYEAAGLACILAGGVMLMSTEKSIRKTTQSHHLYLISAIFMLLLGIGAPITMTDNPFGYISLLAGSFMTTVAILRYRYSSDTSNAPE